MPWNISLGVVMNTILGTAKITKPQVGAYVGTASIAVEGTTSIPGQMIIISLYKDGSELVSQKSAAINSNGQWTALLNDRAPFEPGTYTITTIQVGVESVAVTLRITTPEITAPSSGDVPTRAFQVQGKGGDPGGVLTVHNATGDAILSHGTIYSNVDWRARVTLPNETQPLTFYVKQTIGAHSSQKSNLVTVRLQVQAPRITSPSSGEIPDKRFQVRGTGGNPAGTITLYSANGGAVLALAIIGAGGDWTAEVTLPSETQPLTFYARQKIGDKESTNSNQVTVKLGALAIPAITTPANGSSQPTTFTLTGNQGTAGSKVQVLNDLTTVVVGESGVLTGAGWTCSVTVLPGQASLSAKAVMGGRESERSNSRAYKVRPAPLTTVSDTHTETAVKFSGTGYTGATVEIRKVSGPEVTMPSAVLVTNNTWETTATNWPYGTYSLTAIQKVPDNDGGWIESQPYTFTVNRQLPDVSDVTHTTDYQPTFSGKGTTGATVRLANPGGASDAAPDARVTGGLWLSKASEIWGPTFERQVHLQQSLDGQQSPNWVALKVTIPPLAPGMNEPEEDGLSPKLSGTCWTGTGTTVNVKYSDSDTVHSAVVSNGAWTFKRTVLFAPEVTHTVTVTQTAAGQTSPPVTKTFVVYLPIPQPKITDPAPSTEVGRDVTVHGEDGMAGATMQLRDAQLQRDLGEGKLLTANGRWSIDLVGLEFRQYTIDAQQTRNGRPSERSELHVFKVVVLPPEFKAPVENGSLPRTATIEGTALPFARVDIWLQGVTELLLKDIEVDRDGNWKAEVTLPVGKKTIVARQTFDGRPSKTTEPLNYNVVPAAPFIETPTRDEPIGARTVVSGFGVPGDTITVRLDDAARTVLGSSPVLEDRTWSLTVTTERLGGRYNLIAVASLDGFDSANSPARPVVLGTYLPSIDVPAAGSWVSGPVRFEGQGRRGVGQVVSWFNPDLKWSADVPVNPANWQGEAGRSLPAGGQWCRFTQTLADGADGATISDWVESQRFESLPEST